MFVPNLVMEDKVEMVYMVDMVAMVDMVVMVDTAPLVIEGLKDIKQTSQ